MSGHLILISSLIPQQLHFLPMHMFTLQIKIFPKLEQLSSLCRVNTEFCKMTSTSTFQEPRCSHLPGSGKVNPLQTITVGSGSTKSSRNPAQTTAGICRTYKNRLCLPLGLAAWQRPVQNAKQSCGLIDDDYDHYFYHYCSHTQGPPNRSLQEQGMVSALMS